MYTGALYNTLVTFIAGIASVIVFFKLIKLRRYKGIKYNKGIDYFLLFYGLLWIFVGVRILCD